MCTIINADYLLANVLADQPNVSFDSLNNLRLAIEESCQDVVVDVSSPAIGWALEYYPQIFAREVGGIVRAKNAEQYLGSGYGEWVFTHSVPHDVHQRVRAVIKRALA